MIIKQKLTPNLWFKRNAKEAVEFYVSVFPKSEIIYTSYYPAEGLLDFQKEFAGKELVIYFELWGYVFTAINAGDEFSPTPANSFMVNFNPSREVNASEMLKAMWIKLSDGGTVRMPLQKYDFSELYGWIEDKYGYNWQLILTNPNGEPRPAIIPAFLFTGDKPQTENAIYFYQKVFKNAKLGRIFHYDASQMPGMQNMVMFSDFMLENQWFVAMDGGNMHNFSFTEAVSYNIVCKDQEEIDYYWNALTSEGGKESVCGWCKDKFGISWQINPENIGELLHKPGTWEKLLQMKKIIINELK
ncbi:MAG: VOC family protein [Stygiobacter sp.]|jgi:predicted 3-demethylubiquinone-9 3-methyltransferase (glyoxalase superfamily)|uniref:VOC family protein n=1 Tax=Stygiobacter electus TaxID=3032292 RepID=A0AAE3TD86_9BACT|nr:VOC family protein [Stygiobacter electus]MDF1613198.1 VOC family protein [Stygiobacter electus]